MRIWGVKRPEKIPNKEVGKKVWQKANSDQTKESVKIVSGEGFAEEGKGILEDKEFLLTTKKFAEENKKLIIICWDKNGLQGLRDKFLKIYSDGERREIKEAIEYKTLTIYLAPKRPKWHFAVIDGKYLYIQKKHEEGTQSSKKSWLYCENDFFNEPRKYNDIFDSWAGKCTFITSGHVLKEG